MSLSVTVENELMKIIKHYLLVNQQRAKQHDK